jgi:uncharacterized NAD(P)/FAD-binding protein YdhS
MPDPEIVSAEVVIVGGGYSGTILAAELARRGVSSVVVERRGRIARGAAYSTDEPAHLLNVPAHNMSAFADDPGHFLRRFEADGGEAAGFAERRFYGAYLDGIFEEALATGLIRAIVGEAVSAQWRDDHWSVTLTDGGRVNSRSLVLAVGNEAPRGFAMLDGLGDRYVRDPWRPGTAAAAAELAGEGGAVLILGTGLTMVDTVLSLDEAGFAGPILALSRRGLSPRAHAAGEPAPVTLDDVPKGSVRDMLRWLRQRSARVGWRAAIDSLRPHSHALWQALALAEQRRFLRHARPWWDVHRHRIAPEVARRIADLVAEGQLEISAGRVLAARADGDCVLVDVQRRGSAAARSMRVSAIIDCTGPLHSIGRTANPLLRSLLDSGAVRPDALDMGLELGRGARVAGSESLWALGSLTKGRYWEIIAVPDIRAQAAGIAAEIAEEQDS